MDFTKYSLRVGVGFYGQDCNSSVRHKQISKHKVKWAFNVGRTWDVVVGILILIRPVPRGHNTTSIVVIIVRTTENQSRNAKLQNGVSRTEILCF